MMSEELKLDKETLGEIVNQGWVSGMQMWGNPAINGVVNVFEEIDFERLGKVGQMLKGQFAFMQYPEFQTYVNVLKILEDFGNDFPRAYKVVSEHEIGHKFCPYDQVTAFFLARKAEQGLRDANSEKDLKSLVYEVMNLFSDTCINTKLVRAGDNDLSWLYKKLSSPKKCQESTLWRVYMHSYELLWNAELLPKQISLSEKEKVAAKEISSLFSGVNPLEKGLWEDNIKNYARIIAPFFENEQDCKNASVFDISGANSIPSNDEVKGWLEEIARRLAKPGANGLPTNNDAVREFRDILAGLGEGDIVKASACFYEQLSARYNVKFAAKPYGLPRSSPFSLRKWGPSDPLGDLDVQQTLTTSGIILPGMTTQKWQSRTTVIKGGEQECVPTLDLLIDSSGSMPNPLETVSFPVLASFVAAKRARKQGVRVINYWNDVLEVSRTQDLISVNQALVVYHVNGGTIFPVKHFLGDEKEDPRLSLIITDTFFANTKEAVDAIKQFCKRNKNNRVTIYAITSLPNVEELVAAGAECIHDTTPNIFKQVLGKTEKTYLRK